MFSHDAAHGARDRLLPPSVPFRFFAAGLVFHLAAWLLLALGPDDPAGFAGGPGSVLAALHLATLGVLLTVAMGASFQLLPMATVRPVRSSGWARACFWLTVPGVATLAAGLALFRAEALALGGVLLTAGITVFAALLADNLRSAGEMPVVRECAAAALAALAAMALLGLTLAADLVHGLLDDHAGVAALHMVLAVYGFMGLLVAGFSTILMPMLAIAPAPPTRAGRVMLAAAVAALTLVVAGALSGSPWPVRAGAVAGLAAGALHVHAMTGVLRARMRRRLGTAFVLVRWSWAMLLASLAVGVLVAFGVTGAGLPTVFGILAVAGWLLSFLFGVLQRIAPFLASVHATLPGTRPPLVSRLTAERPLALHAGLHIAAVILLAAGAMIDAGWLMRAGAVLGAAGALSLIVFAVLLARRARGSVRTAPRPPSPRNHGDLPCST